MTGHDDARPADGPGITDLVACPACGGAGGGPFGRAGSAWDVETYECPRCEGAGRILASELLQPAVRAAAPAPLAKTSAERPRVDKPGPAKVTADASESAQRPASKRASNDKPG